MNASMFYTDSQGRVRFIKKHTKKVKLTDIEAAPVRKKAGFFFKDEQGRTIFAGGPSSGGGSATSEGGSAVSNIEQGEIASYYRGPEIEEQMIDKLQNIGPWESSSAASELGISSYNQYLKDVDRWVRGADQSAKEDIQSWLQDPQIRTLSLYGKWSSDTQHGYSGTFKEWLDTPQVLYRGGGRSYPFMSFAQNERVAHDASGGQAVWKTVVAPRNWLGASGEVWIESEAFESIPVGIFL